MSPTTEMHLKGLEQTLYALPGKDFHPCVLISIPRSYKTAVITAARRLGMIEISSYNYMGQPFYRIGEKWLMRKANQVA